MDKKLLGYYDYTVILTYCGMLFAFFGILCVLEKDYWNAVLSIMLAGICDMFDGTIANTKIRTENEKKFGIQIDSLSDFISFGILPGIFVYMISDKNAFVGVIASLFILCALIRLAYFNVLEEERQKQTNEKRKSYLGVPVTSIAIILPIIYLLYDCKVFQTSTCFIILLVLMGIGYISPIEIKKPNTVGKIGIIIVGIFETLAMMFSMGWDII